MPTRKLPDAEWTRFKDRWKRATEAETTQRQNELDDLAFEAGLHWDPKIKSDREREGKPALVIDLLSGPIKTVTNQQRLARPGIKITAVGHGTDEQQAEYWQGIVRRVERLSQAGRAYSWAGQHQAKMGRGFWAIRNVHIGRGFEQDIRIEEIDNQHTVYCDPATKRLDGLDKKWAIRFEDVMHEEYKARFGDTAVAESLGSQGFSGLGDTPPAWITAKYCRIAEYYSLKTTTQTRHLLEDGTEHEGDLPEGVTATRSRDVEQTTVAWTLLNGAGEVLDEATIPGEYIPIVMVYGERRNIDGVLDFRGLVRMAKDPNRMEDYAESSLMEAISTGKTAPWLVEWDQVSEFKDIWAASNRSNPAFLPYKRVMATNGAPLPAPQRVSSGVDVTALTLAAQRMQNHVRNVTGNADVFQEETRSEQSGRAIRERKMNQELGTSDYMENLGDGIVVTAKIIMSMAREIYDTPRVLRIVGADEKEKPIVAYKGAGQQPDAEALVANQTAAAILNVDGHPEDYDIAISAGKRHDTARQETVDVLEQIIPKLPPELQKPALIALLKNIDGPGMPELVAQMEPKGQDGIPPEVQQQLQQLQQQLQQAIQFIETDQAKQQAQLEKSRIDNDTKVQIAQIEAKNALVLQNLEQKFALLLAKIEQTHETRMLATEHDVAQEQLEHSTAMGMVSANNAPSKPNGMGGA